MRIKWWKEVLDETWIHPEIHKKVYELIEKELGIKKKDLKLPIVSSTELKDVENKIDELSEKYDIWFETLQDVIAELQRPGLDPREEIEAPTFKSDILEIEDLEEGMELEWVIRNVTDFWAFVDIWLHSDGLVHKSQMANFFVKNPVDVVAVWQQVKVKVVNIDVEREKVWLSMKDCDNSAIITQKQEEWQKAYRQESQRQQREETKSTNNFESDSESSLGWNISIWWNISFS